jgi:hypothetical protein
MGMGYSSFLFCSGVFGSNHKEHVWVSIFLPSASHQKAGRNQKSMETG